MGRNKIFRVVIILFFLSLCTLPSAVHAATYEELFGPEPDYADVMAPVDVPTGDAAVDFLSDNTTAEITPPPAQEQPAPETPAVEEPARARPPRLDADSRAALRGPSVMSVSISGNQEVVNEHVLSVVTTKVGEPVDEEKLRRDAEAIFELGFFVATDYRVTDTDGGVDVVFMVQENPVVGTITFTGNTVYSSEKLADMIFTKPGMIFNRTFFRNDLQRIKERYQEDGYVMASVVDVQIRGDQINVVIVEPKVSQIVIQGNKITKTYVIRRYLKVKEGELFNANKLRLTLNRLQGLGFFEDVNVNFEPDENPDDVILVLTVEEGRTGRLGFNVSYGTQSGFGGGLSYENFNINGRGYKLNVGFDLGDREEYWATFEQPYMSGKVFAWRIGAYKQAWDDLYYYYGGNKEFEYDRDKTGAYIGFGKKFKDDSLYNWYLTLDWHKVSNEPSDGTVISEKYPARTPTTPPGTLTRDYIYEDLGDGTYYSATASFRRYNIDEYLPYMKGDVETINVQFGTADVNDETYNFVKYWFEAKFIMPVDRFLKDFFETTFASTADRPITFASRLIIGASTGDVPYDEMYTIGGDTTLRGYEDDQFHGQKMLLGNFELRIPMDKAFTLVAFFDVGRAWRDTEDISFGSDLGYAPGIGVRLNTPLGNIRLDYAKGRDDDRFHFGFGELF